MNDANDNFELNLSAKYGFCNDVKIDNFRMRKIIWLVPHVIRRNQDNNLITWRCNWGHLCKSGCLYAKSKEHLAESRQDNVSRLESILTMKTG